MKPCISQATTLPGKFADDVNGYADGGCEAIEVWLTKLETHLETHTVAETQELLRRRGVTLPAAAYQGGLLLAQGDARRASFDHFKKRPDLCHQFGIGTLLLVADFAQKIDGQSLGRSVVSLTEAGRWAAGFGVRIALEFRGQDTFCTCLETALMLVAECGEPNVGVCLDAFHYFKGPSKAEDLARLTTANLFHVQLCDIAGIPRELMADADRIFPGEGEFPLDPILRRLREIDYAGYVSLELLNPMLWNSKPSQIAELGLTSLRRLIGESA